ncbi:hypothetical protein VF21_06987 [Pseudogymnoascus sp. 05NY08]|nr:hypothetical protein VF21_06987 [Pseudogymnoascus sp. 05NY08]
MAIARKRRKLIPRSKISVRVNNLATASFGEPSGDENKEESYGKTVLAPIKSFDEPEAEKALKTPEPAPVNNIAPSPVETSAERAARLRREVAEKSKALEDLQRMQVEAAEQAIAEEKAEAEKARAAAKADAEEAAAKGAAEELAKAGAESNRKAANKSLKCCAEIAKYAISTYLTQRKVEAADKTLVAKWDEKFAGYCSDALEAIASESQKRKIKKEENEDERPAKIAKK